MVRILTISLTLASFQVIPALCLSGVITHACGYELEAASSGKSIRDHESGCEHEGGCAGDPCSVPAMRAGAQDEDCVVTALPATGVSMGRNVSDQLPPRTRGVYASELMRRNNLPYVTGDLPLLI